MHHCPCHVYHCDAACRSWPTIGELRGKIMFVADPGFIADYNTAFPNLTNAVMFTSDGNSLHPHPKIQSANLAQNLKFVYMAELSCIRLQGV